MHGGTQRSTWERQEAVTIEIPPINAEFFAPVGIVEHRDRPLSPVRYFTQADINHGKIAYRPPTAAPHLREIIAFSFAGKELSALHRALLGRGVEVELKLYSLWTGRGTWTAALLQSWNDFIVLSIPMRVLLS